MFSFIIIFVILHKLLSSICVNRNHFPNIFFNFKKKRKHDHFARTKHGKNVEIDLFSFIQTYIMYFCRKFSSFSFNSRHRKWKILIGKYSFSTTVLVYHVLNVKFVGKIKTTCYQPHRHQPICTHWYQPIGRATCFSFLIHCWPIRARECDTFKITKEIEKVQFLRFLKRCFNYFFTEYILPGFRVLCIKRFGGKTCS